MQRRVRDGLPPPPPTPRVQRLTRIIPKWTEKFALFRGVPAVLLVSSEPETGSFRVNYVVLMRSSLLPIAVVRFGSRVGAQKNRHAISRPGFANLRKGKVGSLCSLWSAI